MIAVTQLEAIRRIRRRGWHNKVRTLFEPLSTPGTSWPETMSVKKVRWLLSLTKAFEGRLNAQRANYGVFIEMQSVRHGHGRLFFETCVARSLSDEQLKDSSKKGRAIHLFTRRTVRTPMSAIRVKYTQDNRKMVGTPHYFKLRRRSYRQKILKRRIAKHRSLFEVQAAKDELQRMREEAKVGRGLAAKAKWARHREVKQGQQTPSQCE